MRLCRSGHGSQGTAARRRAFLSGATLARATQHGGVCFHRARASSARGHNSTAACASAWRHVNSQSTAARGRALLLQSATTTKAQQHGGVRFYRAGFTERQNEAGKLGRLRGVGLKEAAKRRRTGACCCALAEALCRGRPKIGAQECAGRVQRNFVALCNSAPQRASAERNSSAPPARF